MSYTEWKDKTDGFKQIDVRGVQGDIMNEAIKAGEVFTEQNLTVKRPGNGISPMKWDEVVGMTAKRDFAEDELIEI